MKTIFDSVNSAASALDDTGANFWLCRPKDKSAGPLIYGSFRAVPDSRWDCCFIVRRHGKAPEAVETIRPLRAPDAVASALRTAELDHLSLMEWEYSEDYPLSSPKPRVYFIQSIIGGPIKIGYTTEEVRRRLAALQTGNPHKLKILAWIHSPRTREAELHAQFAHARLEGEWFSPVPELLALIESLRGAR